MPRFTPAQRRVAFAAMWYGLAVLLVACATGATLLLQPGVLVAPLYFLAVILSAWFGGFGPGLVAALLASQAINYFFLPPKYTFAFDTAELPQLLSFVVSAVIVSWWVAARKRAEEALRKSEFRYRNIFEAMTVSFWDLDFTGVGNLLRKWKASGVTDLRRYLNEHPELVREAMAATVALDVNDKTVQLFRAKSREALLGPTDYYWPPQSERVYVESVISAVSGKPYFEAECAMRAADGHVFDALFTVSFPTGAVGRGRILVGIIDMTERNRALAELQRTQAELAHAARVATLGELTASIAHEVNQPLAAIVTSGEASLRWLARETPDLGKARNALGRMINDGKRASDILARIRAMAAKAAPERTRLKANDVVADATMLVRREIASNEIALRLEFASDMPEVEADMVQLQQVVINLIVNAIQAMRQGRSESRELVIRTRSEDRAIVVEVDDCGPGVPPESIDRIFNAFYTTKSTGMGMGLSICRSIVEAHGGRISFANKPGARCFASLCRRPVPQARLDARSRRLTLQSRLRAS